MHTAYRTGSVSFFSSQPPSLASSPTPLRLLAGASPRARPAARPSRRRHEAAPPRGHPTVENVLAAAARHPVRCELVPPPSRAPLHPATQPSRRHHEDHLHPVRPSRCLHEATPPRPGLPLWAATCVRAPAWPALARGQPLREERAAPRGGTALPRGQNAASLCGRRSRPRGGSARSPGVRD